MRSFRIVVNPCPCNTLLKVTQPLQRIGGRCNRWPQDHCTVGGCWPFDAWSCWWHPRPGHCLPRIRLTRCTLDTNADQRGPCPSQGSTRASVSPLTSPALISAICPVVSVMCGIFMRRTLFSGGRISRQHQYGTHHQRPIRKGMLPQHWVNPMVFH